VLQFVVFLETQKIPVNRDTHRDTDEHMWRSGCIEEVGGAGVGGWEGKESEKEREIERKREKYIERERNK